MVRRSQVEGQGVRGQEVGGQEVKVQRLEAVGHLEAQT